MNKKLLVENLENKQNIILFFSSTHCGACQTAKPIVEKIVKSNFTATLILDKKNSKLKIINMKNDKFNLLDDINLKTLPKK